MEERKNLVKERPETNNSTITALISLKWKVNSYLFDSFILYIVGVKLLNMHIKVLYICFDPQELNEEEKKIWTAKAAENMEAYKKLMEEYNKQSEAETGAKQG